MKSIKMKTLKHLLGALLAFGIAASVSTPALAQEVLRISAIPDESPTELQRKFKPLGEKREGWPGKLRNLMTTQVAEGLIH